MKRRYSPPKGCNTRAHLSVEAPYVLLICKRLSAAVDRHLATKWKDKGLGYSLTDCRAKRRFSELIKVLQQDIIDIYKSAKRLKNGVMISPNTLKRFLNQDVPALFLQNHTKEMLAVYLEYESWEAFKQTFRGSVGADSALSPAASQIIGIERKDYIAVKKI